MGGEKPVDKQRDNNSGYQLGGCTGKGFLPGECGNPKGRPKGFKDFEASFRAVCKEQGIEDPEGFLLDIGMKQAAKGGGTFYKDLVDRVFGPIIQAQMLGAMEGGIRVIISKADDVPADPEVDPEAEVDPSDEPGETKGGDDGVIV